MTYINFVLLQVPEATLQSVKAIGRSGSGEEDFLKLSMFSMRAILVK